MPEEVVGRVSKYFAKPMVAAVSLSAGPVRLGDRLRFKGHTTDFEMEVSSIQEEHQSLEEAVSGQMVGLKVTERVREGDQVFLIS